MKVSIIIPAHNEAAIIKDNLLFLSKVLPKLLADFDWEVVVAENGSKDSTQYLAEEVAKQNQRVKVIPISSAGKGLAIKTAWDASEADVLIFMDADLATDIERLPDLIKNTTSENNLVIGNRWHPASKISRSLTRTAYSKIYNLSTRKILGTSVADHQCGFKSIDRQAWKKISPHIKSTSWFFDSELLGLAKHFGYRVGELPVNWSEKRTGKNKSRVKIIKTSKHLLINLFKLRHRLARLPKE